MKCLKALDDANDFLLRHRATYAPACQVSTEFATALCSLGFNVRSVEKIPHDALIWVFHCVRKKSFQAPWGTPEKVIRQKLRQLGIDVPRGGLALATSGDRFTISFTCEV